MFSSTDSFALAGRAVLRFVGVIMNGGELPPGWSILLKLFTGKLPSSLSYTGMACGNMMFGAFRDRRCRLNLHRRRDGADERAQFDRGAR